MINKSFDLSGKQAIVTHLPAIEELAGVDVLCSDKTGTLTKGELTLGDPFTVGEISPEQLMRVTSSQISVGGMAGTKQFSLLHE